jgi:NADH:ubiquinone oxidoreductase subunit 3 (subunit A)
MIHAATKINCMLHVTHKIDRQKSTSWFFNKPFIQKKKKKKKKKKKNENNSRLKIYEHAIAKTADFDIKASKQIEYVQVKLMKIVIDIEMN